MSVEVFHLVSSSRRGIDFFVNQDRLEPGSILPLGRLRPSKVIATCETKNKKGTIIVREPNSIVIELHQSEEDRIGTIIDTEGLSEAFVPFANEQWVALYRRGKNVKRKIELFHIDDDFGVDDSSPIIDGRLSL